MSEEIRVRFAPSPTGFLHIGGARTALFNWLYARHNSGKFVLRIEDTDKERSTDEYIDAIIEGMKWLDLDADEGPFRQTDRFDIYKGYIDKLVAEGKAYYCYCSPEELDAKRKEAMKQGKALKYDGKCRDLDKPVEGVKPVVRFRMPHEGQTTVEDLIKGNVSFDNEQLDDLIIARSDGTPTYNLTVVVDDVDMKITHVIRGDDHLNNTPRQTQIYEALGYKVPKFAHLPMILGADKARLSKRHGATSVMAYYEMGYLPDALINYLVRLGWSYGDQEVFTKDELVEYFSFENVGKAASIFNPEKLLWLNAQYIMNSSSEKLGELVMPFLVKDGTVKEGQEIDMAWLAKAIDTLKERSKTLLELAESLRYYISEDVEFDEKAKAKFLNDNSRDMLVELKDGLTAISDFTTEEIEKLFNSIIEKHEVKLGKLAQPVRVALTGGTQSPGIFEVIDVLGKEKTVNRLERAIQSI
ncbi:glutamate--tRNA ligase [bacterium BMS3Bbin09]|nr:glutamate--tRNA ligase [bacterium BMS3Bbin09]